MFRYLVKCVSTENLMFVSEEGQFMRSVSRQYGLLQKLTVHARLFHKQMRRRISRKRSKGKKMEMSKSSEAVCRNNEQRVF